MCLKREKEERVKHGVKPEKIRRNTASVIKCSKFIDQTNPVCLKSTHYIPVCILKLDFLTEKLFQIVQFKPDERSPYNISLKEIIISNKSTLEQPFAGTSQTVINRLYCTCKLENIPAFDYVLVFICNNLKYGLILYSSEYQGSSTARPYTIKLHFCYQWLSSCES